MRFLSFLFFLILPCTMLATSCDLENELTGWTLEVRAAYYTPSAKKVRKIYSSGWLDYQIETSKRVFKFFEVWGGVSWANKYGHARSYHHAFRSKTHLSIVPLSLGIKGIYPLFGSVECYVGAGVCYSFLRLTNHCREEASDSLFSYSSFRKEIHKNGVGAIVQTGFHYTLSESVFLDFFADYLSQQFRFSSNHDRTRHSLFKDHLNCSGFKLGGGLGVYF